MVEFINRMDSWIKRRIIELYNYYMYYVTKLNIYIFFIDKS